MVDFVVNTGQTRVELDKLMQSVAKLGANTDALEAKLDGMGAQWAGTVLKMTGAARDAEARFRALAGEANALKTVLQNADIVNRYSKAMLDLNAAVEQSTLNAIKLESAIKLTNEGYRTAELAAKERLKTAEAANTAEVRSEEAFRRSAIALEQLTTITGRLAAIEAERVKGAEAIVVEETKQANATALRAKQTELLNAEVGKKNAISKVEYDSTVRMATAEARQAASLRETAQAIRLLQSPEGQRLAQLKVTLSAERQASEEKARHAVEAEKLRREIAFLQTEEGQRLLQLRAEAAAERQAATAAAEASVTRNAGLRVGNQLTASMRAGLMGLRTSIGMYTSSTIIAASATFGIARAIRSGIEAGADFTATMARTQAVMGATGAEAAALEAQVRAIGTSSQFTATEVAKAATELGLIGLTAGQAMIALRPVMNLATIGDISIAQSAKLATDAMLIFGKTVDDMAHITDIYAVAAAESSATVDELATSISYAGPAARALGISLEDTTAAVETLSNAGIRGSRAGTALRMMFDRLADPSGKGVKAMKDLGISIEDIRGKAMNLGDILAMMNNSLNKLSGSERLAKLGDLFGVRQASAVANLLANSSNYTKARVQLELAQGAAAKMVEDLRDAASFDWKNLRAAFESMQINVFKNNEFAIRSTIERLRAFVLFLSESVDGGVTRLELYATRLIRVGEALALIYGTAKLISFTRGLSTTTLRLQEQADAYLMVAAGANKAQMAAAGYSEAAIAAALPKPAVTRATAGVAGAVAGAGGAAVTGAAGGLLFARSMGTGLLAIGTKVLGVLGWIGVAVSIATTLYQLYRTFTDKDIPKSADEQAAKAAELKAQYESFKAESTSRAQTQAVEIMDKARVVQVQNTASIRDNIAQLKAREEALLSVSRTAEERANVERLFNALLSDQETKLANASRAAVDMANAMEQLKNKKVSPNDIVSGELAKQIDEARKLVDEAQSKKDYAFRLFGSRQEQEEANANLQKARDHLAEILDIFKKFKGGDTSDLAMVAKDFLNAFDLKAAANASTLAEGEQSKNQQLADALAEATKRRDDANKAVEVARQKVVDLDTAMGAAAITSKAMKDAQAEGTLAIKSQTEAIDDYNKALAKTQSMQDQIADYERKHQFNKLTPAQRTSFYANQRKTAQQTIDALGGAANVKPEDLARLLQAEKDRNEAENALGQNSKSAAPKGDDNFIQKLREQLDPIAAAATKLREEKERLIKVFTGSEGERNLLLGQLEYNQLKASLEFSTASLEDQIAAIEKWKTAQLAAAQTEGQRLQIEREARALSSQRINDLKGEQRAVEDYINTLKDQEEALQQQMDDRVAAIGVGSQEAQQMSALTKLRRDYNSESTKLLREHNRTLDGLDAKYDEDKINRENRRYEKEKAALFVDFQEKIAITKQGYEDLLRAQGSAVLGIRGGLSQVIEDGTNVAGKMQQAVVGGFNDMTDAVVNFAKTGKFSLRDFALNFAEMMLRMEMAALAAQAARAILGLFAPSGTQIASNYMSGGGASFAAGGVNWGVNIAGANGLAFDHGTVTAMAKGGLITKPTLFPMANGGIALGGEADTEAIMPLKRMSSGDLGVRVEGGSGGDIFNFHTNVNVASDGSSTSSSSADDSKAGRELAKMIEAKTKEIIVRATQPGGILWKQRNGVTA